MAGRGSRFAQNGYSIPKPLIPIHEIPMIRFVIENLRPCREHKFIFICLEDHLQQYDLKKYLAEWSGNSVITSIDYVTDGAACTVLKAEKYIDNDDALMIANSDQWIEEDINNYLAVMDDSDADGLIMTMSDNHPKWSFVRQNQKGEVVEIVEKKVISNEATVGIYNFRKGSEFVRAATKMINDKKMVNGEYYVAPVYNEMIAENKKILIHNIGELGEGMHGLGVPEDLIDFVNLPISEKEAQRIESLDR